ncbi:MAG: substrate-binding domain-containing protein [Anaerolineales bacterium]|nr:substrate-binding domain-containing protein [Anaerolineales bacterium]
MTKPPRKSPVRLIILIILAVWLAACRPDSHDTLRLATTTSTYDSGLLDVILPEFEARYDVTVEVIAVGTGQALGLGERGDVDVVLVHDPVREEQFIAAGHGVQRTRLMYNDFILVGPSRDPASVHGLPSAAAAFESIAAHQAEFASRGDQSGTHAREVLIWDQVGFQPDPGMDWYLSLGQGMGSTLQFANEKGAYTLTDRGTYLSQLENLPNLAVHVGGASFFENQDETLLNCYSVMIVNPERHAEIEYELARLFIEWITEPATKSKIGSVGLERFDQPFFYPADADGEKPVPGQPGPSSE